MCIRDSYKGASNLGAGKDYVYPHDHGEHFFYQQYLPDELKNIFYYKPTEQGQEKEMKLRLQRFWGTKY